MLRDLPARNPRSSRIVPDLDSGYADSRESLAARPDRPADCAHTDDRTEGVVPPRGRRSGDLRPDRRPALPQDGGVGRAARPRRPRWLPARLDRLVPPAADYPPRGPPGWG